MFFHVRDLELKPAHFDVELPAGSIEFLDPKLKQAAPLQASGMVELVTGSLGEIRVKGQVRVRMQAECDRCLEPAGFPIDSSFEPYYRPVSEGYLGVNANNAARRGRRPEAAIAARAVRVATGRPPARDSFRCGRGSVSSWPVRRPSRPPAFRGH